MTNMKRSMTIFFTQGYKHAEFHPTNSKLKNYTDET